MSSVIVFCTAIVVTLSYVNVSEVTQKCPRDMKARALAIPDRIPRTERPVVLKPALIKKPKANVPKCRKGEKVWRKLKDGRRKYRIRRTC